jgi:hypothetical protein
VNQFHAAGGMAFVVRELINAGLAHESAMTIWGPGLSAYAKDPFLVDSKLVWRDAAEKSHDEKILRPVTNPFSADGGLKLLRGNLGRSVIKTSAVDPKYWDITAPARVFESQEAMAAALKAGLNEDFIAVVRGQGRVFRLVSQGPARGHRYRRTHVGRIRQSAVGNSSHAGGSSRRSDRAAAGWRHHTAGCECRCARSACRCRRAAGSPGDQARLVGYHVRRGARALREAARRRVGGRRGRVDSLKPRSSQLLEQQPFNPVGTPWPPLAEFLCSVDPGEITSEHPDCYLDRPTIHRYVLAVTRAYMRKYPKLKDAIGIVETVVLAHR